MSDDERAIRTLALIAVVIAAGCAGSESTDPVPPGDIVPGGEWENLSPIPNVFDDVVDQPRRQHPYAVAVTPDGSRALVTMRGSEIDPGDEVVVVDTSSANVTARLTVGSRPVAVRFMPAGDLAVVLSHLSPYAAVVDAARATVVGKIRVGYYAEDLAFARDGRRMYVSNRADDSVQEWHLTRSLGGLSAMAGDTAPAGTNPGAIAIAPDNDKVYVADAGGLGVRVYGAERLNEIAFIFLNAPVFDIEPMGDYLAVATLNGTSGLPCVDDADYPGDVGDGIFEHITDQTCGRGFADIQNEIAFIDPAHDLIAVRYTSDSAEVSEADREGDYPTEMMQVVGSLPHSIAVVNEGVAYVTMGASFEVAEMTLSASAPPVPPSMNMPRTFATGFAPRGVAVDAAGTVLLTANMLGETVSIFDLATGARHDVVVGNTSPPFPATDAEMGELFFFTSRFSTDGDQSCAHCHPDAESDGKSWGVSVVRPFGRRATLPARNLRSTRPLLVEGVFDENDFSLEIEGMAFRPDFHDSSYTLQLQRRDDFFRDVSLELFGTAVGFDEMVLRVGSYLMVEPRLLPSPFPSDTPEVERGRALFFSHQVGCFLCHPSPTFASPEQFEGTTTMARFDRTAQGLDPDVSIKFLENARDGLFNANTLRGLWDRRGTLFHDGRARTIRETLLTPGHPCLLEGERPFNERDGVGDVHGGISHLACDEIDALVSFLRTID